MANRPCQSRTSRRDLRWVVGALGAAAALALVLSRPNGACAADAPLATLDYRIVGVQLQATPAMVSVPKGVAGSVLVQLADAAGRTNAVAPELAQGAYIEAIFRGPSFPARRLVAKPNEALMLPALSLVGDYQLDAIRLVDAATGAVRLEATPRSVPVHVFDEVLISQVTSRPLSLDEIQQKGIVIDQQNFRAVEFEVGFVLDGRKIPVRFPVVTPQFPQSTEIIPAAERERRLVQAAAINNQLASDFMQGPDLPKELQAPGLNIQIKGVHFEKRGSEPESLALTIPPIPALLVIPGSVGYLHQFFSVQVFTENGAPAGSGLSVRNVQAKLKLPPGPDQIPAASYDQPGDDPLRFARVGPTALIHDQLPIAGPAPVNATRFQAGEGGSAEFLVEGLQEGLHVMDLDLTASLDGLAGGTVAIAGKAAGSVLVRNPKFALSFLHPRTVSYGEPYTASVTILNTGDTVANLVSVTLPQASISGARLDSPASVVLGNLEPGQSAMAQFRIRAQRTGRIKFSNLTTGDSSVQGRFVLALGIDERGVELSPDSLVLPSDVETLPTSVVDAARRVLGQGLSAATAGRLPAGVTPVARWILTTRALELAEAGQRMRYGDTLDRVLADLMLDWQGGRAFEAGFDQIVRETDAGREWRAALAAALIDTAGLDAAALLADRARDLAGRGEAWLLAGSGSALEPSLDQSGLTVGLDRGPLARSGGYRSTNGHWLAAQTTNATVRWTATADAAAGDLALLRLGTNGVGRLLRWTVGPARTGTVWRYDPATGAGALAVDADGDGTAEANLDAIATDVAERAPEVLVVRQEPTIDFLRVMPSCYPGEARNYGNLLAVMFSKPMTQTGLNRPSAYTLDSGIAGAGVQIQQGNRVALVSLREPVSAIVPRALAVSGIADQRGHAIVPMPHPIQTDFREGVALRGRVLRMNGSPAVGIPVTLTLYDRHLTINDECLDVINRLAQKFTDAQGYFDFDFVYGGVPFTVAAVDTGGLDYNLVTNLLGSFQGDQFRAERYVAQLAQSNVVSGAGSPAAASAVALAEGLDRAVWNDQIDLNSGRAGTTQIIGLRFRGRGTVTGRVVEADLSTPAVQAAVNLFPDAASREQGRGVYSDNNGRFQFNGVPLGNLTVTVSTSQGHFRTVAEALDTPGQLRDLTIVLTAPKPAEIVRASLQGRVTEADGVTAAAGAQVFLQTFGGTVAAATADDAGVWVVTRIPVGGYGLLAVSRDRQRSARGLAQAQVGGSAFAHLILTGHGRVIGRVESSAGLPVADALVAGGRELVRTDAQGNFTLEDIPEGSRVIRAGLEADKAPGGFPRLGQSAVNVLPGADNFVVVRLTPAGRIVGQVRGASGGVVPNVKVAIPLPNGYQWVEADAQGRFEFLNLPLGRVYLVTAPAPPTSEDQAADLLGQAGVSLGQDEADAQMLTAVAAILAHNQDLASDAQPPPEPASGFGWTSAQLRFDGETAVADIALLPMGKVSGSVLNDQGVPIGARVRLTGIRRGGSGAPEFAVLDDRTSDAATGAFEFTGLLAGAWGLQAASPFYPTIPTLAGQTTKEALDVTNVVLQFAPVLDTNGRLTGRVIEPDGTPAGEGVRVQISFGNDYVIQTDTNGFFDTHIKLPARTYTVEARDPRTGLRGLSQAAVRAGLTNVVNVTLLGQGSARVQVLDALGQPVAGAEVGVGKNEYPGERFSGRTDANGEFALDGIFQGSYSAHVIYRTGVAALEARGRLAVGIDATTRLTLTLGPTASLHGVFRSRAAGEPIPFAKVNVGGIVSVTTDVAGQFLVSGLALGTYRLLATDPVTGLYGTGTALLTLNGQVAEAVVTELAQGEINGTVFLAGQAQPAAGVSVSLFEANGLNPQRSVTTGPDGAFRFPGVLPGDFSLRAFLSYKSATASGHFPDTPTNLVVNLTFPPDPTLGSLRVTVLEPDRTPATNATVTIWQASGPVGTTADGVVVVNALPMALYQISAQSLTPRQTSSFGSASARLTEAAPHAEVTIVLSGVGAVRGRVFESDGVTPAAGAEVWIGAAIRGGPAVGLGLLADADGEFAFGNLPLTTYTLTARAVALAASDSGTLTTAGQTNLARLVLGPSGTLVGRLVRADGANAVSDTEVVATFRAPSGLDGVFTDRTDAGGAFRFDVVPVGAVRVQANRFDVDGTIYRDVWLATNGQVLDLGRLILDEAWPRVLSVTPADGAQGVGTTNVVDIAFSEPIRSGSFDAGGVYLSTVSNTVAAAAQLMNDTNGQPILIRLTPKSPLRSLTAYRVVAVDGNRMGAIGQILGRGPRDLVDRPLLTAFTSSFTTRDDDPPQLVSLYPTNRQIQVDPRAVLRASFSEPVRPSNYVFTVTGPAGAVPGSVDLGFSGMVLVFTPSNALPVNATYTLTVDGVADLAGNRLPGQPLTASFSTLDTLGPSIATLRLAGGATPVAGATLRLEALLASAEPGVSVRFSADLGAVGVVTNAPFLQPVTLPTNGFAIYRAIATDRFGNDGPVAELRLDVVPNLAPQLALTAVDPTNDVVGSSRRVIVRLEASDDVAVTNATVLVSGALETAWTFTNAVATNLTFTVPPGALAGSVLGLRAGALDALGVASSQARLDFTVQDRTVPALAVLSPTNGARISPLEPLSVQAQSSDNSAGLTLLATLQGTFADTQAVALVSSPGVAQTTTLSFPMTGAPLNGGTVTLTVTATDGQTNTASVTRTLALLDLQPPHLLSVTPTNGTPNASPWLDGVRFGFDEPIEAASVSTNSQRLWLASQPVPLTAALVNAGRDLLATPVPLPLLPGNTYTGLLSATLADPAHNRWVFPDGAPPAPEGLPFGFTTARFLDALPTNGAVLSGGTSFVARVTVEPGFGANYYRFTLGTNAPLIVTAPGATNVEAKVFVIPDQTNLSLRIDADRYANFAQSLPLTNLAYRFGTNVATNKPPVAQFSRTAPVEGPLALGMSFSLRISATDDYGVTNLTLQGAGAIPTNVSFANGAARDFSFKVPTNAVPADGQHFRLWALDTHGATSAVQALDLPVLDPVRQIAPDEILYSRAGQPDGAVYVAAADGTNERQVTMGEMPRLSHDGRFVAFKRDGKWDGVLGNNGSWYYYRANLYVRDLWLGDERLIIANQDYLYTYGWRPGTTQLVTDYWCGIGQINADGTGWASLNGAACSDDVVSVNPVDGRLSFVADFRPPNTPGISVSPPSNLAGKVHVPNTRYGNTFPVWSPDGEWIAFEDWYDHANLWKVRPDGSGLTQLTSLTGTNLVRGPAAWTADGSHLIAPLSLGGTNGLFAVNTDGSGLALLVANAGGADYDMVGSIHTGPQPGAAVRLAGSEPAAGSVQVSLWPETNRVLFTRSIVPESITGRVRFTNSAGLAVLSTNVADGTRLWINAALPLRPGVTYTNLVSPGIKDRAGNLALLADGTPWPAGGVALSFTTARVLAIEPAAGTPVYGGTGLMTRVAFEPGLGANFFRFTLGNNPPVTVPAADGSPVEVSLPVLFDQTNLNLRIAADRNSAFAQSVVLTNLALAFAGNVTGVSGSVVRSTLDADADGWLSVTVQYPYSPPLVTLATHTPIWRPGGWITLDDPDAAATPGNVQYWLAPAKYLGNRSAAYGGHLAFDLFDVGSGLGSFHQEDVILVGAGLTLVYDLTGAPGATWTHYEVPLVETGWRRDSLLGSPATAADLQSVLAALSAIYIRAEYQSGADTAGLDDFVLAPEAGRGPHDSSHVLTDDFSGGLDAALWRVDSNYGFTVDATHGDLRLSKPADTSDAWRYVYLTTPWSLRGDFDVSVDFANASIARLTGSVGNQVQLQASFGGTTFIVVRGDEAGSGQNVHVYAQTGASGQVFNVQPTPATGGILRIVRTGPRVQGYFGASLIYSNSFNTADATFALQFQNNQTRDAIAVTFDSFRAAADRLLVSPPVITSATNATTRVGWQFAYRLTATPNPLRFGALGLPAGLDIDPANGWITGSPTEPGHFAVQLSATNRLAAGVTNLLLTVYPNPPVPWPIAQGGNDHGYRVFGVAAPGINWADANAAATNLGGYLATLTSAAENSFVYSLVTDASLWFTDTSGNGIGPWLGGFQPPGSPEPAGNWRWITGEPLTYSNWARFEPSNTGGAEDRIGFFGYQSTRAATWNDNPAARAVRGYVVEFDRLGGTGALAGPASALLPDLSARRLESGVILLSWPSAGTCYRLEASASLDPARWSDSLLPIHDDGAACHVSVPAPAGARFFRLVRP